MSRWKAFRYRLEEAACRLLAWAVPRLSRRSCVRLGNFLGLLAYRLDRRGRAVAEANVECVFGPRCAGAARQALILASYRNFLRTMLDLFWGQRLRAENFHRWIRVEGFDASRERLRRERKGGVFMCIHQGNWEWASLSGGFTDLPLTLVTENFKNPRLTEIFRRLRQHTGQVAIPQENSLLRMLKVVKRGGFTAIVVDLSLRPSQAAAVVEAFPPSGMKMCLPLLHAVLAQRAGALLIPCESEAFPDGTVRITTHPPVEFPPDATLPQIVQACWEAMQAQILQRPEQWLWAYKHFRYRPPQAEQPYPPYAHHSRQFEKLLRQSGSPNP